MMTTTRLLIVDGTTYTLRIEVGPEPDTWRATVTSPQIRTPLPEIPYHTFVAHSMNELLDAVRAYIRGAT